MSYLKPTQIMIIFASCFTATQALSVGVNYSSNSVELIMIDPETAAFECAYNDLPAHIEIGEDTRASASVTFEPSLFGFRVPPQEAADRRTEIVVRRGVNTTRVSVKERPLNIEPKPANEDVDRSILTPDEWHVTFTGQIDVCVGLGTLQVVDSNLDVLLQVGQYEGQILDAENMPENLRLRYGIDLSNLEPPFLFRPKAKTKGQIVGNKQIGSATFKDGRNLGLVSLFKQQAEVNFSSPTDPEGFVEKTWLSTRFILVMPTSVSD